MNSDPTTLAPGVAGDGHLTLVIVATALVVGAGLAVLSIALLARGGYLGQPDEQVDLTSTLRLLAVTLSLGAAAIHFAVIGEHFQELWLYGIAFAVVAWFQGVWALVYFHRPARLLAAAAIAVNVLVVVGWTVSRIAGLPLGERAWVPEAIGFIDLLATCMEVLLVITLLPALEVAAIQRLVRGLRLPAVQAAAYQALAAVIVGILVRAALAIGGISHDDDVTPGPTVSPQATDH